MGHVSHHVGSIDRETESRFRSKVMVTDACHIWEGAISPDGHGRFSVRRRSRQAHRVAYTLAHGDPGASVVRHTCDNPWCVAPYHLVTGTNADNVHDAFDRGQLDTRGDRSPMHRLGKGRFDEGSVREVRSLLRSGMKQADVARKFAVRDSHIADIRLGRKWAWVSDAPATGRP